ncbi:MAG: proton-conducting transporter membrane subunit [Armatimonadota bacterium]
MSQLGYMFIACGSGAYWAGMFHVTTHAFFKALLFLGAGAVIHAMAHDQDMRNYGMLKKYLPITGLTMLIGWLAISGFPFLAGFYSKEEALGAAVNSHVHLSIGGMSIPAAQIAGWIGFGVAFLTAAYMTRMTMLTFFSGTERWRNLAADHAHHEHHHDEHAHAEHHDHGPDTQGFFMNDAETAKFELANVEPEHHHLDKEHKPHEVPWMMWVPLVVLAVASVFGGFLLKNGTNIGKLFDFFNPHPEPAFLEKWLYPGVEAAEGHMVSHGALLGISLVCAFGGMALGWALYYKQLPENEGWDITKWKKWRISAGKQFGIDHALADGSVELGAGVGKVTAGFDVGVVDGIVNGVGSLASGLGGIIGRFQRGYVRGYALVMQLGAAALIAYFVYLISTLGGELK